MLFFIWRRAVKIVQNRPLEGMRGGVCAGRLDKSASSPSSGTSIFSVPQRRARFPGFVSFSFPGPLKSQWALQAFEDTRLGMRGVCAAQGDGVPRKAVPAKRSGKACLCKTGMREGMRTIYILSRGSAGPARRSIRAVVMLIIYMNFLLPTQLKANP